jgi:Ca2+-binding RTX toxin-like protein
VENLTVITPGLGVSFGNGNALANEITGDSGSNVFAGLDGNDTLIGNDGDDALDGGAGADSMSGGSGDDHYYVDNIGDKIVDSANGGYDTVDSSVTYTLGGTLERLFMGDADGIDGTGNSLDNYIGGGGGDNVLSGLAATISSWLGRRRPASPAATATTRWKTSAAAAVPIRSWWARQ